MSLTIEIEHSNKKHSLLDVSVFREARKFTIIFFFKEKLSVVHSPILVAFYLIPKKLSCSTH